MVRDEADRSSGVSLLGLQGAPRRHQIQTPLILKTVMELNQKIKSRGLGS